MRVLVLLALAIVTVKCTVISSFSVEDIKNFFQTETQIGKVILFTTDLRKPYITDFLFNFRRRPDMKLLLKFTLLDVGRLTRMSFLKRKAYLKRLSASFLEKTGRPLETIQVRQRIDHRVLSILIRMNFQLEFYLFPNDQAPIVIPLYESLSLDSKFELVRTISGVRQYIGENVIELDEESELIAQK